MVRPAQGVITAGFDQVRERADGSKYVHGGLDIAPPDRDNFKEGERDLVAVETGKLMAAMIQLRTENRSAWSAWGYVPWPGALFSEPFPFANYTIEFYGVILVLVAGEETYVYAHLNEVPHFLDNMQMHFVRESAERSVHATLWGPSDVEAGSYIGKMGWFGKVLPGDRRGCHLHIEGHKGHVWHPEKERIKLEEKLR